MRQAAVKTEACLSGPASSAVDTRHLGQTLRAIYEGSVDKQPIPDAQVDLLLRLRQKERDLRRSA
ncbi:hypothetical protein [uncultured Methylobacterium sp.]|uniref:hypothetical protein n=1 Tax=uncultured Methylobacterium sp. TaxID=157278 RepID=UPI0035CA1BDC